jgi:hypothetical protein
MGQPAGEERDQAYEREALRLHRRYQIEIVEAWGLCPWAEGARLGGKVRERIVLGEARGAVLEGSLTALTLLAKDRSVEVGFLVYPRFAVSRLGLEEFAAQLREADGVRYEIGNVPFVFAAFHPDAEPDTGDPERLIPFLRRTPDPTLQLVRASVLDSVRSLSAQGTQFVSLSALEQMHSGHVPVPLRERIARTNLSTVNRMGVEAMRAALDDIRRDRDETYARLEAAG